MKAMKKWIYLNSDDLADALALVTVLSNSKDNFNIVRKSVYTPIFQGLDNVSIGFYDREDELIKINSISAHSWQEKCIEVSNILGVSIKEKYEPYLGFVKETPYLDNSIGNLNEFSILYLFPNLTCEIDLVLIDKLVRILEQQDLKFISAGSSIIPCIHGTKDYRGIVDINMVGKWKKQIKFILTTEKSMIALCEALDIKVFVLSFNEGITINRYPVNDANQIANYILSNI